MRILLFVLLLTPLFLTSCVVAPVKGANNASDLEVMRLGIHALAKHRQLPGPVTRMEDTRNFGEAFNLGLDLEDVKWLDDADKDAIVEFTDAAIDKIKESREPPCRTWDLLCRARRK